MMLSSAFALVSCCEKVPAPPNPGVEDPTTRDGKEAVRADKGLLLTAERIDPDSHFCKLSWENIYPVPFRITLPEGLLEASTARVVSNFPEPLVCEPSYTQARIGFESFFMGIVAGDDLMLPYESYPPPPPQSTRVC